MIRCAWLIAISLPLFGCSQGASEGSAEDGATIYRSGRSSNGAPLAAELAGGVRVVGELPACGSCHGRDGGGGQEGGVRIPSIRWAELTRPYGRRHELGQWRPGYTAQTLARAIRLGVSSSGVALDPLMPRYDLSDGQMADLLSYLRVVGETDDEGPLQIGALLPLRGEGAPEGRVSLAALEESFEEVNRSGGIFGRRLQLVPMDSSAAEAASRLMEAGVVALLVDGVRPAHAGLQAVARSLPVIDASPVQGEEAQSDGLFHVAPSDVQRACAAARYLARPGGPEGTVLIVRAIGRRADVLQASLENELKQRGRKVQRVTASSLDEDARRDDVAAIVEVGNGQHLRPIAMSTGAAPPELLLLPPALARPVPGVATVEGGAPATDATAVLVAALEAAGTHPTREALLRVLAEVTVGQPGSPYLRFGRHRRLGASGAWIVTHDSSPQHTRVWISSEGCASGR